MAVKGLSASDGRRASLLVALAALVVTAGLIVLGAQLASSQSSARRTLAARFHDRSQIVSALIQAELASVADSTRATRAYASPVVSDRVLDQAVAQGGLAYAAVLDGQRHVLAASHSLSPAERAEVLASPALARVLAGAPVYLSDAVTVTSDHGMSVVDLVVPLRRGPHTRVVVGGLPTGLLSAFLGTYLKRLPTSGQAYVLDGHGDVVGASTTKPPARSVADGALLQALARDSSGSYGSGGYFVASAVPGSTWRVVLTSTRAQLFSSVSGSHKWLPWMIYIALAIVALAFLVVLRRLLSSAAALAAANAQLSTNNTRLQSTNALLRRAAELARSNAELEQFASIASHDLQEPLRKVQTFAAQLNATEGERLSDHGQDFLRRMSAAAGRMRSLIDDLLVFSRVSTQARPFTSVNLGDIAAQVLVDLEVSIAEAEAQVTVGPLPTIEADPLQMRQLLQNLIGNALKFRRDDVVPELRVAGSVADHIAELTVGDNGIGFDDQYATRIFRAFERLHGINAYPGTGIGLALCRKIVERHHGTITAAATPDHGATFTVRLPLVQPEETAPEPFLFPESNDDEVAHVHA